MKIAICEHLTASYWGGGEKEMYELAMGLKQLGHEVEVYALPYTLENRRKVDRSLIYDGGIPYHEGLIHPVKADVCYLMYHPFSWLNFPTSAPKIASFHSQIWFSPDRRGYGLVSRTAALLNDHLLERELSRYDAVHVHYPATAREIEWRAPRHPRIHTIEHFVDTDVFRPNGGKVNDKFHVLYVGRPVWQKGFDLFVRLAHDLADERSQFSFVGGETQDERITSYGLVNDPESLAKIMGDAHIVVSPQRVERTVVGRSVLEALSCGTPVVLMTKPVDPPLGDCESLFTTDNYGSLRSTVREFYRTWRSGGYDEARLSSRARQCVVENYSLGSTIRRYESMFEDVIRNRA